MKAHYGEYFIPVCGAEVKLDARVAYRWTPMIAASRDEPADGGAEIEVIHVEINLDWIEITDWRDELVAAIKSNIAKEHRRDVEEFEHEESEA